MNLKRLYIKNFKKFPELELELMPFQLLVGPNNSGKSTVLQACSLLDFCYRVCVESRNGGHVLKNRTLPTDEFSVLPVASPRDLWLNRRLVSDNTLVPLSVRGEFVGGRRLGFDITFSHNRFSIKPVPGSAEDVPRAGEFSIALIPGFTGFLPQEEKRTPAVRRDLKAHGQHATIIRNILLDLRDDADKWHQFVTILATAFPQIALQLPEFDEEVDRYISVKYSEERPVSSGERKRPDFDLFAAGSGFHQFTQIFAGAILENASTILLDEPDAHLYGKLQTNLYNILSDLAYKQGHQILAATHSTELVTATKPNEIITFANGTPSRLNVAPEMLAVVERLGAIDNLQMVLVDAYRRVVVVEDKSDQRLLEIWMERVMGAEFSRIRQKLVFMHAHRRPNGDTVNQMLNALASAFRLKSPDFAMEVLVIADRDYRTPDDVSEELRKYAGEAFRRQKWHIWDRVEIENYHLQPDAIVAALREAVDPDDNPLFADQALRAAEWLEGIVEEQRDAVVNRYLDQIQASDRGLQGSTALERARAFVEPRWSGKDRYKIVDAKGRVFPKLRERVQTELNVNFSDAAIIRAMSDDAITDEMRALCDQLKAFVSR